MLNEIFSRVVVSEADLQAVAAVVVARMRSTEAEEVRLSRVRKLLAVASELSRALDVQTRYTLIDHRGTHGANDLPSATHSLYEALQSYAAEVRELAEDYSQLVAPLEISVEPVPAARSASDGRIPLPARGEHDATRPRPFHRTSA